MSPTCETCRFWLKDTHDVVEGVCRRHPPVLDMIVILSNLLNNRDRVRTDYEFDDGLDTYDSDKISRLGTFPGTTFDEWCGDHEPKPSTVPQIVGSLPDHHTTNEA